MLDAPNECANEAINKWMDCLYVYTQFWLTKETKHSQKVYWINADLS